VASLGYVQIGLSLSDGSLVLASFHTKVIAVTMLALCLLIFAFSGCLIYRDHGDLMHVY
jgi:hypothetical protein